ncbi:MAG: TadE family protein, partial [Planctomycetota bacterium]|nr:TadE family protein [Planctomycetota bacterium]
MNLNDQLENCATLLTLGSDRRRRLRSGIQTLEAVLAIPVLLIGMFAFFQFGPLVTVQQAVTQAAIETAREISKVHMFDLSDAVDLAVAENVVNEVLGVH